MYISEISLTNFRIFNQTQILFNEKMNVLIGPNNSGKTTIIKGLQLLFDRKSSKRLKINDFNKNITLEELKQNPPKITISAKLNESEDEGEYSPNLVTVASWFTKLKKPFEAQITYEFFLPEKHHENYKKEMLELNPKNINDCWNFIETNYLMKYIHKTYVGHPELKNTIDYESLNKFDFQFLSAIRDVTQDLASGKKNLLKEILNFFLDYDIKTSEEDKDKNKKLIRERKEEFNDKTTNLYKILENRMDEGKKEMLKYVKNTGASIDEIDPDFYGDITEEDLLSYLNLIINSNDNIKIPIELNGLGYNNLIYISLVLAKIQRDSSEEYLGENSKFYSILAIEEPEAHLHPNMQYKFLKFLKENQEKEVNQIFITTHSPNITAALSIDDLIVIDKVNNKIEITYPSESFKGDIKSKRYVERFLDVTKSDLFFAKNIIFVEGITEQLLIPEFARYLKKDLSDTHTSIINLNNKNFKPFLKLFNGKNSMNKKVACITDLDPCIKNNNRCKGCYPYQLQNSNNGTKYSNTTLTEFLEEEYDNNIKVYSQTPGKGKTFEYELILENPQNFKLITSSMSNGTKLKEMMNNYKTDPKNYTKNLNYIKEDLHESIKNCDYEDEEKNRHIIATKYLDSIKKGEVAQELSYNLCSLSENIENNEPNFIVPNYIKEAINWIVQ